MLLVASTTGYQVRVFAEAAARLGVGVVLATDRCHVLDDPWRDNALAVRFDDGRLAESAAGLRVPSEVRGVVAVGDAQAEFAARVAARLGLPFHPPEAARAARNKALSRERFAAAGLPVPRWQAALAETEPGFPCVVKPTGLSASRGVIRANNRAEYLAALRRIHRILGGVSAASAAEPAVIVEDYIPGREFAVEGLVRGGRLFALAIFDKPDPLEGPFFEETIYVTPSREPAGVQEALLAMTQSAVTALGLSDGPIHAELRYNEQGAWPLEVAARPIGGLCARALRFGARPLEEVILRHALGEDLLAELTAAAVATRPVPSGVMMIPLGRRGRFVRVTGVEAARAVPLVEDVVITAKPGQLLEPLPEGHSYLGFVFARGGDGDDAAAVERAIRAAHACLDVELAEVVDVVPGGQQP